MQLKAFIVLATAFVSLQEFVTATPLQEVLSCVNEKCTTQISTCLANTQSICATQWNELLKEVNRTKIDVNNVTIVFNALFTDVDGYETLECTLCSCQEQVKELLPEDIFNTGVSVVGCPPPVEYPAELSAALNCTKTTCESQLEECTSDEDGCNSSWESLLLEISKESLDDGAVTAHFLTLSSDDNGMKLLNCSLCECGESYEKAIPTELYQQATALVPCTTISELEQQFFTCVGTKCSQEFLTCTSDMECATEWATLFAEVKKDEIDDAAVSDAYSKLVGDNAGSKILKCSACSCADPLKDLIPEALFETVQQDFKCKDAKLDTALNCTKDKCGTPLDACLSDSACQTEWVFLLDELKSTNPDVDVLNLSFQIFISEYVGKALATCALCECGQPFEAIFPDDIFDDAATMVGCGSEPPDVELPELECGSKTCSAQLQACMGSPVCKNGAVQVTQFLNSGQGSLESLASLMAKLLEDPISKSLLECLGCKCESDFAVADVAVRDLIKSALTCKENSPSSVHSQAVGCYLPKL